MARPLTLLFGAFPAWSVSTIPHKAAVRQVISGQWPRWWAVGANVSVVSHLPGLRAFVPVLAVMIALAAACGAVLAVLAAPRPADARRVVATESDVRELTGLAPLTGSLAARPTAAAVNPAN